MLRYWDNRVQRSEVLYEYRFLISLSSTRLDVPLLGTGLLSSDVSAYSMPLWINAGLRLHTFSNGCEPSSKCRYPEISTVSYSLFSKLIDYIVRILTSLFSILFDTAAPDCSSCLLQKLHFNLFVCYCLYSNRLRTPGFLRDRKVVICNLKHLYLNRIQKLFLTSAKLTVAPLWYSFNNDLTQFSSEKILNQIFSIESNLLGGLKVILRFQFIS